MTLLNDILTYNEQFVQNKEYERYETSKFPDKRLVILSCMDTRLVELLPRAMNIHNGDAKIIKNAGAIVTHPFGSVMRSILVAIYELQAEEVCVVAHHGCGMSAIEPAAVVQKMIDRGVSKDTIELLAYSGVDVKTWMRGFDDVHDSVRNSVQTIVNHPLLPRGIPVHGLVIDPGTGKLDVVVEGY